MSDLNTATTKLPLGLELSECKESLDMPRTCQFNVLAPLDKTELGFLIDELIEIHKVMKHSNPS